MEKRPSRGKRAGLSQLGLGENGTRAGQMDGVINYRGGGSKNAQRALEVRAAL